MYLASSTPQNQGSRLPTKFVYVWEFHEQDDCWLPFVRDQQEELEEAYFMGLSELHFPPTDGQKRHRWGRVVSFDDMTQRNEETGKVRDVRRRELKMIDEEEVEKQLHFGVKLFPPWAWFPPSSFFPLNTLANSESSGSLLGPCFLFPSWLLLLLWRATHLPRLDLNLIPLRGFLRTP